MACGDEAAKTAGRAPHASLLIVLVGAALLGCGDGRGPLQTGDQPSTPAAFDTGSALGFDAGGAAAANLDRESGPPQPTLDAALPPEAGDAQQSAFADPNAITYQKNIRALLERSCIDCHSKGGIGPIPLDDWPSVENAGDLIVSAVSAGTMPPGSGWSDACRTLNENRALDAQQIALFTRWREAGFPEGNATEYVAPTARPKQALGEPTLVMSMKEPHTPPAKADEYRCFLLDAIAQETYLTGMQILPGQLDEVHHVIVHRVDDATIAEARSLDQADAKPGYLCHGGPGVSAQNIFSYRPGSEAVTFAPGDAAYLAAGSNLLIQVHYNTVFLANGKAPTPDTTKVLLWTLPAGQLPERVVYRTTTFGPINIPANASNVVSNISQSMGAISSLGGLSLSIFSAPFGGTYVPGEIIGVTPHAHQLAKTMSASLKRADASTACLADVKWDFQWQLDYMFDKGVPYTEHDTFVASCTFDNTPANQPVINGIRQTPKAVSFGERSTDEMCEHYIWLRFARDAFLKARGR